MDSHGRNTFLGLNYQARAALALFLQYFRYSDFESIQLEAPHMQDFNLHFRDGRKIVCEAKSRKRGFTETLLKNILSDLRKKRIALNQNDEFLVITQNASDSLKRLLKRVKNLSPSLFKSATHNTAFSAADVPLLQKVRIYETEQEDSAQVAYALMSELIGGWLDEDVIKQVVDRILVEKIYEGSAVGRIVTADEFKSLLNKESSKIRSNVGADSQPALERLTAIKQAVNSPSHPLWAPANLSAISAHWGEVLFAADMLKGRDSLHLCDWSRVIEALVDRRLSHLAFEIIRNNLRTKPNVDFAVDFLLKHARKERATYLQDFRETELMELGTALIKSNKDTGAKVLEALIFLVGNIGKTKLLVKANDRKTYLRQQAGKLASVLYEDGDHQLKRDVVQFIARSFCLVEDEGEYWHKASPDIYDIVQKYLCSSVKEFDQRFEELTVLFASQYSEIYKRTFNLPFKGYELIGGVSTWLGDAYQVHDRFFVRQILTPALSWYLQAVPKKALVFITGRCVFEDKKVKKYSPDFLRRAAIPVLVDIYHEDFARSRNKAHSLLGILLRSRKGMPSKHELIYQAAAKISDEALVWELLQDALDSSEKPINPFVEKTVCSLASKGHTDSIKAVRSWLLNEERWTDSIFGGGPLELLKSISKFDVEGTFVTLEELTLGEYFDRERREIDVYDWCDFLVTFVKSHSAEVTRLLKKLHSRELLSESQQVLLMGSIAKVGKDESFSEAEKLSFYSDVVEPVVHDEHLVTKFPVPHIREQLTEFVEGLVKNTPSSAAVECALSIMEVLVNDPSPDVQKDTRLSNDSEVFTIESVRGKTAWALQHFFAPVARPYLERSIRILEKLLTDESTYIRGMACYPFSILLANRFTFTNNTLDTPLLGNSLEDAYAEAKVLEERAIRFVEDNINLHKNLTKHIPKLFDRLRLVAGRLATRLWQLAEKGGVELMKEVLPILLFNSHFRERFVGNSKDRENPFLSLISNEEFDPAYFREKLRELTLHPSEDLRASLSSHIMKLSDVEEDERANENVAISLDYFKLLSRRYDQDVFRSIYMFIDRNLEEHFYDCIQLWFALIEVEEKAIKKAIADGASMHDVLWWPFCFNGKLLSLTASKDPELFLRGVEALLEYPTDVHVDLDDDVAAALLNLSDPRGRILNIYDRWLVRDSLRLKDKDAWLAAHL